MSVKLYRNRKRNDPHYCGRKFVKKFANKNLALIFAGPVFVIVQY